MAPVLPAVAAFSRTIHLCMLLAPQKIGRKSDLLAEEKELEDHVSRS